MERAFYQLNGKWRHVYILQRFEQSVLWGKPQKMATIKITKSSHETYDVEADKLQNERPRRLKVRS